MTVSGQIGDQPVQLNNAATEATLQRLVAAVSVLGAQKGSSKNFDRELQKFNSQLIKAIAAGRRFDSTLGGVGDAAGSTARAFQKSASAAEDEAAARAQSAQALNKFTATLTSTLSKISGAASSVASMGNSITGATSAMGKIPLGIGSTLEAIFSPTAAAAESTYKSFQQAASVGATFGGSINEMINDAGKMGLTYDQLSGIISRNGEKLAIFGGTTEEGAKIVRNYGKDLRASPVINQLAALGYTTESMNENMIHYMNLQRRSGNRERMTTEELISRTTTYMKNLDAISKLTGVQKEQLQAQEEARLRDAKFQIVKRSLDEKSKDRFEDLLKVYANTPMIQEAIKEMASFGHMGGEASQQLNRLNPQFAQMILGMTQQMNATKSLTQEQVEAFHDRGKILAQEAIQTQSFITQMRYLPEEIGQMGLDLMTLGDRAGNAADSFAKTEQTFKEGAKSEAAVFSQLERFIADTSNRITQALISNEALASLRTAFQDTAVLVDTVLIPAMKFAAENFYAVAAAVATLGIFKSVAGFRADRAASRARGARGTTPPPTTGGTTPKPTTGGAGGTVPKTSLLGRGANPALAAGFGAYDAYQGYTAADEAAEAGLLTPKQETVKKAEAIGGGTGGATGAIGGAALGAKLGLLTGPAAPIVSPLLGLAGGVAGYFGGSEIGEELAGSIADFYAGPDTVADIQAKIAQEQERIKRSEAGENEYWGREEVGRLQSEAKINSLTTQLERAKADEIEAKKSQDIILNAQKELEIKAAEEAAKKAAEDAKKAEEAKKKTEETKERLQILDSGSGALNQKDSKEQLAALNSNIEQLLMAQLEGNSIAKKQLSAAQGMTGDLFAV